MALQTLGPQAQQAAASMKSFGSRWLNIKLFKRLLRLGSGPRSGASEGSEGTELNSVPSPFAFPSFGFAPKPIKPHAADGGAAGARGSPSLVMRGMMLIPAIAGIIGCSSGSTDPTPPTTQTCTYTYNAGACTNGVEALTVATATPEGCSGTPLETRVCGGTVTPPTGPTACTDYSYTWGDCQSNSTKTPTSITGIPAGCRGGITPLTQTSCTYIAPNQAPSAPSYNPSNNITLTEPCNYGIILSSTDTDGSYVQTGGNLPPS